MKKIIRDYIKTINYYFNTKETLLVYLLVVIGVLVPTVSGNPTNNFFYRFFLITNSRIYHIMLFFAMFLNVGIMVKNQAKNYMVILRCNNYMALIKRMLKDTVRCSIYLNLIAILLVFSGAIVFCFGDFTFINHPGYDINIVIYLIFSFFKNLFIYIIVNCIIFYLLVIFKNFFVKVLIVLNNLLLIIVNPKVINNIFELPILYHYYFISNNYNNFLLELLCSLFEILILCGVAFLLYKFTIKKKRDLI